MTDMITAGLKVVSLFSGIGGIDRGLELAGASTALVCEYDKHARNILTRHFPGAAMHNDVTELTADDCRAAGAVPLRTILTAGWPCQGNSVAGRRGGMDDPRSGLWSHVVRLLDEFRPAWFIGENVPGLLSVNNGHDFSTVVQDLAGLGYGFTWRILDARHFGVPQRRRRVIIVGRLGDTGAAPAQVLLESDGMQGDPSPHRAPRQGNAGRARSISPGGGVLRPIGSVLAFSENQRGEISVNDTMPALKVGGGKPGQGYPAVYAPAAAYSLLAHGGNDKHDPTRMTYVSHEIDARLAVRRLSPLECERLQGFPDGWTAGQTDGHRYKQLGNSVAVPVFEWVGRRLVAVDRALNEAAA